MELINFVEELQWRGMIHDVMPDTDKHLMEKMRTAYVGFDPTADSSTKRCDVPPPVA